MTDDRRLRAIGVSLVALTGAAVAGSAVLLILTRSVPGMSASRQEMVAQDIMVIALGVPGAWLLFKLPQHPVGWLMVGVSTALALNSLGGTWAAYATSEGRDLPFAAAGLVLLRLAALSEVGVPLLLLVFPNGRLPSPRWRPVFWATAAAGALIAAASLLVPLGYIFDDTAAGEVPPGLRPLPDLTGLTAVPDGWWPELMLAVTVVDLLILVPALASLLMRYRRADDTEMAQLRWLAVGGLAMLIAVIVSRFVPATVGMPVSAVATVVLSGSILVAVLRYRLQDAAPALNRSLVYAGLTGLTAALYAAVVAVVSVTVNRGAAPWLAAAVVAVAFAPVRNRLQHLVDRWVRGDRSDPYGVVSGLSRQLDASMDVPEVVQATVDTVADAFRAPWVRLELDGDPPVAAERGTMTADALVLPLETQGRRFATLTIAQPRGSRLSSRDRLLLSDLIRHSHVVVQSVETARQLQQAREELVAAREEERRRLRRDLHDGLGPQLAALTLKLDAVRNLNRRDPDRAAALLADAKGDVLAAVDDIRRLSHDLRPPALDEVGLLGAVQQQLARFEQVDPTAVKGSAGSGLKVQLQAPDPLGTLPAAVEVAAYRIVSEAVTNVVRHAGARRCAVSLQRTAEPALVINVRDDGRGLSPGLHEGVGLSSMRARAAEVGGDCLVRNRDGGGTILTARLPLVAS